MWFVWWKKHNRSWQLPSCETCLTTYGTHIHRSTVQQLPEPAKDSSALHPGFKSFPWNIFISPHSFLNLFCLRQIRAAVPESEACNICSVTTLDRWFQVFFQLLEDAKASRNHHTSLLNPAELGNQRLQILNYCSPHPTKTGHYLPCKQEGGRCRMTKWLFHVATLVWESQELNL